MLSNGSTAPARPAPDRPPHRRLFAWLPVLVLVAGVTGAAALAAHLRGLVERERRTVFRTAVDQSASAVRAELSRSEQALLGLRGLFLSSEAVRRDEFARYVAALDLAHRYASMRAVTFVASVPPERLAAFVAGQRRTGARNFAVRPAPLTTPSVAPSRDHRVITFVEPGATQGAAPGVDVRNRASARTAQDRSRDTGAAVLTGRVVLVGERAPGFALYVPVYRPEAPTGTVAERRAAIAGWLLAGFRGSEFLAGVRASAADGLALELFDGDRAVPDALLGGSAAGHGATLRRTVRVNAAGHRWTLRVSAAPGFAGASSDRGPLVVVGFGLLLSVLVAVLVHILTAAHRRADRVRTAERRDTGAELRRLNADLEAHNGEVEALARLQRDFVSTTSHELRTPLTSIIGYLEIVLESGADELPDDLRAHLQTVWRSAQRLLALVGDLLTVDLADAGAMEVHPLPLTLGPLVAPAVHDLELACVAKGLRLSVGEIPSDLVVHADPERFRQVFDNLIGNAIKFTPAPGEIRIGVRAVGDQAELTVSDTGPGIPADELPHIFERFYRTSSTAGSAAQGTGLGLSIARALVRAHGGTLTAASTLGEGTTFTVSVPLAAECVAASVGAP